MRLAKYQTALRDVIRYWYTFCRLERLSLKLTAILDNFLQCFFHDILQCSFERKTPAMRKHDRSIDNRIMNELQKQGKNINNKQAKDETRH